MCKKNNLVWLVALAVLFQSEIGLCQSQSEYALIRRPVFNNPLIWKLTKDVTNDYWDIDLFGFPRAAINSYIMTPGGELLTAVLFTLDHDWNRLVYIEGVDNWIRAYGSYGSGTCQFWWPKSLDVLAPFNDVHYSWYHYIYVADTENDRIVRLQYDWRPGYQYMICNSPITGGGLERPADLNLNDAGTFWTEVDDNYLWVVNAPSGIGPSEIKRFTIDGVLRSTFGDYGCDGQVGYFCHLTAIVSGRSAFLSDPYDPFANTDEFFIADVGNNRIVWLIKATGGETIGWIASIPASSSIVDLEVDIFGQLWALDRDNGTITKYSNDLFPLCTFGSSGTGVNQFWRPNQISNVGGYYGSGNMYVVESWSDSSGSQYFAIGTDILDFSLSSSPCEHWHYISYVLIDPSDVSVKIYNQQAGLVKTLFDGLQFSGPCSFVWDGLDDSDQPAATGEYRVEVVDTCTYWNVQDSIPVNVVTKEAWVHHIYNPTCCNTDNMRGNVNGEGGINTADLTYLVDFLFFSGSPPPCIEEADVNGDASVNVADLPYLVDYLFFSGPAPAPCP